MRGKDLAATPTRWRGPRLKRRDENHSILFVAQRGHDVKSGDHHTVRGLVFISNHKATEAGRTLARTGRADQFCCDTHPNVERPGYRSRAEFALLEAEFRFHNRGSRAELVRA